MEDIFSRPSSELHGALHRDNDRCAGCNATGSSLLACDDFEGRGGATSPSQRSRWVSHKSPSPLFFTLYVYRSQNGKQVVMDIFSSVRPFLPPTSRTKLEETTCSFLGTCFGTFSF
jgi:hypothetical protein